MKNKEEILNGIDIIIEELNLIISDPELLKSKDARKKIEIKIFTRKCSVSEYRELFEKTLTYPFGSRKYNVHYLYIRVSFWLRLRRIITEYEFQEKDRIVDIFEFAVREADAITFKKLT